MIDGIRFKVCGITSLVDAHLADRVGADYIAFNFYPKSPRFVSPTVFAAMAPNLPDRPKVAVFVEPSVEDLHQALALGFDRCQVHFGDAVPTETVRTWSHAVSPKRLWLAPKLPPGRDPVPEHLPLADTWLIDTFVADSFGGSGKLGDWPKFRRLRDAHPNKTWVLAGGLNPANIGAALESSDARFVDVNSGVETSPGVKDEAKLKAFVVAIHRAKTESVAKA